jgi:hypothetical protein
VSDIHDLDQFRSIILHYNEHRISDPFMTWFREQDVAGAFASTFEKILVVLIDARFDQQTKAENALKNTKHVVECGALDRVIGREAVQLLIPRQRTTAEDWTNLFVTSQHRLRRLAKRIEEKQRWNASTLLACMLSRNYKVPYLGLKTSRLAVRWLHELVHALDIDMSDFTIPVDVLVYRVASRLGIIDPNVDTYTRAGSPADRKIQSFAKALFPDNPWFLDEALWSTGRQKVQGGHCYPISPQCHGCIFYEVCPKHYANVNPDDVRVGDKGTSASTQKTTKRNAKRGMPAGTCPNCRAPLVWRKARRTGELYRGCTNFQRGCRWQDRSY